MARTTTTGVLLARAQGVTPEATILEEVAVPTSGAMGDRAQAALALQAVTQVNRAAKVDRAVTPEAREEPAASAARRIKVCKAIQAPLVTAPRSNRSPTMSPRKSRVT